MTVYLDNAATTALSGSALSAMEPIFKENFANPSSSHSYGQRAKKALEDSRKTIAGLIGASPSEITFTSGGSESDCQAILSAAKNGAEIGKTHVVSTAFEHHAVLKPLEKLQKEGFEVTLISPDENGIVSPEKVRRAINEKTCLVSVMYANNEIGAIQPVAEIGAVCREQGVIFHTDAVQAAGYIKLDVDRDCVDMLTLSAHKFHGPKGIGALYVRKGVPIDSVILGGAQERGKRAGTENVAGAVGMAAALEEAVSGMEQNNLYVKELRDRLEAGLLSIPGTSVNGGANRLPGTVNICFDGIEGEALLFLLDSRGVCVSAGSACASGSLEPSHVLLAIGKTREQAKSSLRFTLSRENTREEIDYAIETTRELVSKLREAK